MTDWQTCHHCKSSFTSSNQACQLCIPKEDKIVGSTIAIASEGDGLAAKISLQFGRCQYYCLCNIDALEYTFIENPAFILTEKAGYTAATFLKEYNVTAIVAGRFGTKTMGILRENNIQMIIPPLPKSVGDLIKHQNNNMKIAVPTRNKSVDDHFGHCESYTIFSIGDNKQIESTESLPSLQGCGCKSNIASVLEDKGVAVILAGNMGQGALNVLTNHNMTVYRGCSGDVEKLVESFLQGTITDSGEGCHHHEDENHQCNH